MLSKSLLFVILVPILFTGCGGGDPNGNNSSLTTVSKLAASQTCISLSCHGSMVSTVTGRAIADEWLASTHNTNNGAGCADCHEPAAGHPNLCSKCHGGTGFDVTVNPDQAGKCNKCHGLAHPQDVMVALAPQHFGNQTTSYLNSTYRASYVSSNYLGNCRKCHDPHDTSSNHQLNADWAASGHGNVTKARTNYDFKTRGSYQPFNLTFQYYCVRCHTTTGFINFVESGFSNVSPFAGPGFTVVQNAPVQVAPGAAQPADTPSPDKSKEVTGCDACHDDGNGNAYGFQLRAVPAVKMFYNFSSSNSSPTVKLNNKPVNYPDTGASNLCVACHSGRGAGSMIYDAVAQGMDFTNTNSPSAHDRPSALNLFQTGGYEFTGRSYANTTLAHVKVGMGNFNGTGTSGPCVTCHMESPNSHSFLPVTFDSTGAVNTIISNYCKNCHNGVTARAFTILDYNNQKKGFAAALAVLNAIRSGKTASLANKNTNYNSTYPGGGANTMGALFNYSFLSQETGAFAHNPLYAKRLIWDSIDWLDNGVLDNDVVAAINALPTSSTVTSATKAAAIGWLTTAEDGVTPVTGRP